MKDKKKENAKRIAKDLGKLYNEMLDAMPLEDLLPFFRLEVKLAKKMQKENVLTSTPLEKILTLEKAVDDYEAIYAAEKAEAEKMPLSRCEAIRVKKLLDEINNSEPLPETRKEHQEFKI